MAADRIFSEVGARKVVSLNREDDITMDESMVVLQIGLLEAASTVYLPEVLKAAGRIYTLMQGTVSNSTVSRCATDTCYIFDGADKDTSFTWVSGTVVLYSDGYRWYVIYSDSITW